MDIKLYATGNTVINGLLRHRKLMILNVGPARRMKDILLPEWLKK